MKKLKYVLLVIMTASLALGGCKKMEKSLSQNGGTADGNQETNSQGGKLKVVTSFYTMYDFAVKIGGDKVDVKNMVPAGTEPHDWEPAATDVKDLETADIFIYNGADMEHWTDDVLDTVENRSLKVVEASRGVHILQDNHDDKADRSDIDDHDDKNGHNDRDDHDDKDDDHDQKDRDSNSHDHGDDDHDPHVWLNPLNAKIEMENIKNALIEADQGNKDYYTENYEKYARELDKLDAEYKKELANTKSKNIITAHEAFGYLCSAYGLNQIGVEGISPDSEPDPARMNEIIKFAKEQEVKTIFFEELVSPKVVETIASEIGAKTEVLNPLEGLSEEEQKAGDDYFSVMRANLEKLKVALNE